MQLGARKTKAELVGVRMEDPVVNRSPVDVKLEACKSMATKVMAELRGKRATAESRSYEGPRNQKRPPEDKENLLRWAQVLENKS